MESGGTPVIMVVDDTELNREFIKGILAPGGYTIVTAADGEEALDLIARHAPDVLLTDVIMPGIDGFELTARVKSDPATAVIPVVVITSLRDVDDRVQALDSGADDFLGKPVDRHELIARVRSLLKVKAYNDHMLRHRDELLSEVAARTRELNDALERVKAGSHETIIRLSRAAEFKDDTTGHHIRRIALYSSAVARELGLDDETVETIHYAAPMHDIGKIGIPDRILLKKGFLDADEWSFMKRHTTMGRDILAGSDAPFIRMGETIALTHHEKWDGTGYPGGLEGTAIPLVGRIVAVVDVFDALLSRRPYKEPYPPGRVLDMMRVERERHFDPGVLDAMLRIEDEMFSIMETCGDDEGNGYCPVPWTKSD